ncbi:unnamed protein product [Heterobilharzia americana]|nr:unnamed protein product [Heterobilharzia americana]
MRSLLLASLVLFICGAHLPTSDAGFLYRLLWGKVEENLDHSDPGPTYNVTLKIAEEPMTMTTDTSSNEIKNVSNGKHR